MIKTMLISRKDWIKEMSEEESKRLLPSFECVQGSDIEYFQKN